MPPFIALPIAAVRTAATYLLVSLYILLVGPPGILVAMLTGKPDHLYWLGIQGVRLGFSLCGLRYVAEGTEHIRYDRAVVYAMNHTSNLEPPVIYMVLRGIFPRFQLLYKAVLRKTPVLGRIFDIAGFVPIERRDRVQSDRAIAQAVRQIREGYNFVVFPEGTRSRTGELLPFKKGAFIMAIRAQVPIVPVAIVGTQEAMRKGSPFIWPTTIQVKLGAPIPTEGLTVEDRDQVIARVWEAMAALIAELREARPKLLSRAGLSSPADAERQ